VRRIHCEFDGRLALDCWVITPGTIRLGDKAELTDTDANPASLGGRILGSPTTWPEATASKPLRAIEYM
jgi:hypothetical protein